MASQYAADLLAANAAALIVRRRLRMADVDTIARLPAGTTRRVLNADPDAFPCPTRMHRLALALGTTTTDLLSDGL